MKDTVPMRGNFKIELWNDYGLVDSFDDRNMVMNLGKEKMAQVLTKLASGNTYINKIVLGGEGHVDGDLMTPKTENEGHVPTRTELFAQENGSYTYTINFEPNGVNGGNATITSEDESISPSVVIISSQNTAGSFSIEIQKEHANGEGASSAFNFTEAGLFIDDILVASKCFSVKSKDTSLKMTINWSIIF